ncbi:MAG: hypothetical protein CMJ40_01630 [Phycisphaerae bacterium]|nr:hypothetical protein [Phycisphaerae bacterium]
MGKPGAARRGFTLVEIIVAGIIMAMLFAAITVSMGQVISARNSSRDRMEAFVRADAAMQSIRSDIASILRRNDLFQSWLKIEDDTYRLDGTELNQDWILLFNNHLRAIRTIDYNGEGIEYESSWQVIMDEDGPVLWQRRDAMPDTYPEAGGVITPKVEGILELDIEAWNGDQWMSTWDSDYDGMPYGIRVSITATGARPGEDPLDSPLAFLRTIIPIDRAPLPYDVLDWNLAEEIALEKQLPPEQVELLADAIANGTALPLTVAGSGQTLEAGMPLDAAGQSSTGGATGIPSGVQLPDGSRIELPTSPSRPGGGN